MEMERVGGESLSQTVREAYLQRKSRNPQFSLRAFARMLGIQPATLSEIMREKRKVSPRYAKELLTTLCVDPEKTRNIVDNIRPRRNATRTKDSAMVVDMNVYKAIAEWQHFAILSLVQTQGFVAKPSWIAQRLGISVAKADEGVKRLFECGLLKKDVSGKWKRTHASLKTSDGVANTCLRQSHLENLRLAETSLLQDSVDQRDFICATVPADPSQLPLLKKKVRGFVNFLVKTTEQGKSPKEVYKFFVQLYPITRQRTSK